MCFIADLPFCVFSTLVVQCTLWIHRIYTKRTNRPGTIILFQISSLWSEKTQLAKVVCLNTLFFFFLTDGLYTTLWYFFYALSVKCTFVVFQIVNIFSSLFFTVPQFVVEEIKMLWMKTCLIITWFIFDFSGLGDGQFKHHSKSRWQQFTLAEFGYDSWCCSKHMTNYLLPWRPLNKMGFFFKPKIKQA